MYDEINKLLLDIDRTINASGDDEYIYQELRKIPLEMFGKIMIDRPQEYPNILRILPQMPTAEIQNSWTGCSGHALMTQSLSFIKTIITTYHYIASHSLSKCNILDFGCGWGRLTRLMSKYVHPDNIYAVDPWDKSIKICKDTGVQANLFISDYIPRKLPTPENLKFDFIMAFSVFTHLSMKVAKICANTLKNYLNDNGIIALTVRPVEYWKYKLENNDSDIPAKSIYKMIKDHEEKGFAFCPHNRELLEGEVTYGDTSMTVKFITENFQGLKIIAVEWSECDSLQLIIFLQKI